MGGCGVGVEILPACVCRPRRNSLWKLLPGQGYEGHKSSLLQLLTIPSLLSCPVWHNHQPVSYHKPQKSTKYQPKYQPLKNNQIIHKPKILTNQNANQLLAKPNTSQAITYFHFFDFFNFLDFLCITKYTNQAKKDNSKLPNQQRLMKNRHWY